MSRYNNAEYQTPEVVYTPTSYNSAPTSMASGSHPWWKDMQNDNTETHYEFSGSSVDGKLEARAVPEANFWQNQPGTGGDVRFAWGDDGHSILPAPPSLPSFSWQSKAPRKVTLITDKLVLPVMLVEQRRRTVVVDRTGQR